jgi:hypothetical protein
LLEALEPRNLPASTTVLGAASSPLPSEPNHTIDEAQSLGELNTLQEVRVDGSIGAGVAGGGDVDWYRFTLDRPSTITLGTSAVQPGSSLSSVLSLYGKSNENPNGPSGYTSYRLIEQDDGARQGGNARLDRALAAGTYFVAVSGSGDQYFNPLLAGSGYPGSTGAYELVVTAADLHLHSSDGPAVLATDPASGTGLARSPFVLRIDFSTALDPGSIHPGSDVELRYAAGTTLGANSQSVPLASAYFDSAADELDLMPAAPLWPGNYQIFLAGNRNLNETVLVNRAGDSLGKSDLHPSGEDLTVSFRISGIKGNRAPDARADDTPASAHNLGELVGAGLVQIAGAIGDDPTNPIPWDPADVDLYHFHIQGPGRYALTAEVFAGRIDSTLDPVLSLFRLDPSNQRLDFVASNDGSFNPTVTHDGRSEPLFTDPLLNAGLTEGDYYLAVSSNPNLPMPAIGRLPGTEGIFDPEVTHSGKIGSTIGDYVLNVTAEPMNDRPQISGVPTMDGIPLNQGTVLTAPPTTLSITFDKAVNLAQLARQTEQSELSPVYIQGSQGTKFFPKLIDYTESGNRADFIMRNGLRNGVYELHLSGSLGLTDLAGDPLAGNDPSGDYVIRFTVDGPARGSNGNPQVWLDEEPNDDPADAQNLGVLFPAELKTGVLLERGSPAANAADTADYYRFRILQGTQLSLELNSLSPPPGIRLTLADASGNPIRLSGTPTRDGIPLGPGTYIVGVTGWSPLTAAGVTYQLSIRGGDVDHPPPLSIGPGPAIWISHLPGGLPHVSDSSLSTGSRSGAAPAVGASHDLGVSPSSALLLLASGPIGGPSTVAAAQQPTDIYASILARPPDLLFSQVVAQLPLLVASPHSGTQQSALGSTQVAQWLQAIFQKFEKLRWSQALDFFYGSGKWQEKMSIRPVNVLPDETPENSLPDGATIEPLSPAGEGRQSEERFEEAVAPAWAVAATLAACTPWEPNRRHVGRRVGQ